MVKIPIEKINSSEGTISFVISNSNLFDFNDESLNIFEFFKGETVFILDRDSAMNIRFIQSNPNYFTKISKVNITPFKGNKKVRITFTWSKEKNNLYIGSNKEDIIKSESEEEKNINFRVDKNGLIYQIGDANIQVKSLQIQNNGEIFLEPKAKEIFDFQITKVDYLIENCKIKDFLFETAICQQAIVMLTSIFEIYLKTRFLEMVAEIENPDFDELIEKFIAKKNRDELRSKLKEKNIDNKSKLKILLDNSLKINFQSWKQAKKAFSSTFKIKFSELEIESRDMTSLQEYLDWRHQIVHSKSDCTILNFKNLSRQQPIFSNAETAINGRQIFYDFITKLHKKTLDFSAPLY